MTDTPDATADKPDPETPPETLVEQAEGLFDQAREAIGDAFEATVDFFVLSRVGRARQAARQGRRAGGEEEELRIDILLVTAVPVRA